MPATSPASIELNPNGRAAAANSSPVVLATEDAAVLSKIGEVVAGGTNDPDNGDARQIIGNVADKFKDWFSSIDTSIWTQSLAASDIMFVDGNVAGASYIDICKSVTTADTVTSYTCKNSYKPPYKFEFGVSLSQRWGGQSFFLDAPAVDANGAVISTSTPPADNPISSTISVTSNVATVNCTNNVNNTYRRGDWIVIYGCADSRLNIGPVQISEISISDSNRFTVPLTIADGSYTTTGGSVRFVCVCNTADYTHGLHLYGASNSNADVFTRNGVTDALGSNGRPRVVAWNPGNTQFDSLIPSEGVNYSGGNFVRPFRSKGVFKTTLKTNSLLWETKDTDSTALLRSSNMRDEVIPNQTKDYTIRYVARNHPNMTVPVGTEFAIQSCTKSGSTTATVVVNNHGLNANSRVRIYGCRDTTNFPNITSDTQVASIVDTNTFTIVWGSSSITSSFGGTVFLVNGGVIPAIQTIVATQYNKSYDNLRLVLTGSGTWTEIVGNIVTVTGLATAASTVQTSLQGRYRVASIATTVMNLEPMDGQAAAIAAAPSGATNCSGCVTRNSSLRLHYVRVLDFTRLLVEQESSAGVATRTEVSTSGSQTLNANITQVQSSTAMSYIGTGGTSRGLVAQHPAANTNADVASAARTNNGSSGTIADEPGGGNVSGFLNVTASSGTNQTLDLSLEESADGGSTYSTIWTCERLTGVSTAFVPPIPFHGRRRWNWAIGGTTPSFTFTITATRGAGVALPPQRQFFDRTAALINGSATGRGVSFRSDACKNVTCSLTVGATTTGAVYNLNGSNDGTNWFVCSADVTAVANSTVVISRTEGMSCRLIALNCKTTGTAQTGTVVSFSLTN